MAMKKAQKHETVQKEPQAETPRIPASALKAMVSAYLLWVIGEIVCAIAKGETQGASPILLALACIFLFGGVCWMLIPELVKWHRLHKRENDQKE